MGRVASLWYSFTKTSHASLGPRVGNFTEQLIKYWIEKYNGEKVEVLVNANVSNYLRKKLGVNIPYKRSKIDFIVNNRNEKILSFIELRESEHTGGKTGQESLMDKLTYLLGLLENERIRLRNILSRKNYKKLELSIAILFSERDRKLLTRENYSPGRFTSLKEYILDERHIGGKIKDLMKKYGYKLSIDNCREYNVTKYDKSKIDIALSIHRRICLEKNNFIVELSILWGDEFFYKYTGKGFKELLKDISGELADDIWLFFTVAINELKILEEFNTTNLEKIYEFLIKNQDIINEYIQLYNEHTINTPQTYFIKFNELLDKCIIGFSNYVNENNIELRLLETNEYVKQLIYLKQLCIVALAMSRLKTCLLD